MERITFRLGLFSGEADRPRSELVLRVLLTALVADNYTLLRAYGRAFPPIYLSGVHYRMEPPPAEEWKNLRAVLEDGHGDCEDLACWRVAELRAAGFWARPTIRYRMQGRLSVYHILVERPGGVIEDPSRLLGMGGDRWA